MLAAHTPATGAKRFILAGGNVSTLQTLLGHTTVVMVRRYVELADVDMKAQHDASALSTPCFRG